MRIYTYVKNNMNITKSEVIKLHKEGRILVNGKIENLSRNIRADEVVTIDGVELKNEEFYYYVYNKPKGVICTNNKNVKGNIIDSLGIAKRLYSVGRLDKDTHGLLFLTNDNEFTHFVLENENIEKEYIVETLEELDEKKISMMQESIIINGKNTTPAIVRKIDSHFLSVIIHEGKYHQVRKLVIHAGMHLVDLKRIRIGKFVLDEEKIKEGEYLRINNLKEMV